MATTCPIRCVPARWPALAALALFAVGGCKTSMMMPKTYPVKGTVVYKDGQPLEGGQVQFEPIVATAITTAGDIKQDGTFSVRSRSEQTTVNGAPSGVYRVTILPPASASPPDQPPLEKYTTKRMYFVKEDDTNNFVIAIPWVKSTPAQ